MTDLCEKINNKTLIYCKSPNSARRVCELLSELNSLPDVEYEGIFTFVQWLSDQYSPDWNFVKAIKKGIGMHHGQLPRAISNYVVRLFNDGDLRFLVCTSTLIEGVNTKAKNVIIYDNKIATRKVDYFTFNNIKGRSGRMFRYFVGNVYLFDKPPHDELPFVDIPSLTQSKNASDNLLLQLDESELTEESKIKII